MNGHRRDISIQNFVVDWRAVCTARRGRTIIRHHYRSPAVRCSPPIGGLVRAADKGARDTRLPLFSLRSRSQAVLACRARLLQASAKLDEPALRRLAGARAVVALAGGDDAASGAPRDAPRAVTTRRGPRCPTAGMSRRTRAGAGLARGRSSWPRSAADAADGDRADAAGGGPGRRARRRVRGGHLAARSAARRRRGDGVDDQWTPPRWLRRRRT